MRSTKVAVVASIVAGLATACQGTSEGELDVGEDREGLWSYPYRGEIAYGETAEGSMSWLDFGERYAYEGTAGQEVTFVVEWAAPYTTYHGAEIWLEDEEGYVLDEMVTWDPQAHITVTIPADGTYDLYVAHHGFGWFSSYPYRVGAEPHMCAQLFMTNSAPEWAGFDYVYMVNVAPGADEDPFTLMPGNPDLVVEERVVAMAHCDELLDESCDSSDPEVCGATLHGDRVFDNQCELRNAVAADAGPSSSSIGAWTEDLGYCSE